MSKQAYRRGKAGKNVGTQQVRFKSVRLMNLGQTLKHMHGKVAVAAGTALLALSPSVAIAQEEAAEASAEAANASLYTPMGRDMVKGQPIDGNIDVQPQFSDVGQFAQGFHIGLVWVMAIISVFVLNLDSGSGAHLDRYRFAFDFIASRAICVAAS